MWWHSRIIGNSINKTITNDDVTFIKCSACVKGLTRLSNLLLALTVSPTKHTYPSPCACLPDSIRHLSQVADTSWKIILSVDGWVEGHGCLHNSDQGTGPWGLTFHPRKRSSCRQSPHKHQLYLPEPHAQLRKKNSNPLLLSIATWLSQNTSSSNLGLQEVTTKVTLS